MNIRQVFLLVSAVCTISAASLTARADLIQFDDPADLVRADDPADLIQVGDPVLGAIFAQSAAFQPVIRAIEARDFDQALEHLDKLKVTHSDIPGTWELDGTIKIARRDYADAEAALRQALELAPETASIHTKLGAALLAQDRVAEAERALTKALSLDPTETGAALMLARLAARRGDAAGALAHYESAARHAEDYSIAHQELAESYLRSGNYEAVLDLVEPLLETAGSPAAHLAATRAYIGLERLDEAAESLDTARQLGLASEEADLYEAVLARFNGDMGRSESLLRKLLGNYPDRPLLIQELAITLAAAGDSSGSREAALRAAALLPEGHAARVSLANLLLAQGLAAEALDIARGNVASGNQQALVVVIRAGILAGDLDAAEDASQRFLAAYPEYVEAFEYRSEVLLRRGQRTQALEVAERGTRSMPQNVAAWSARVTLMLRLGDYASAARTAQQGVSANPDSAALKLQLANALQLGGDTEAAEDLYRELSGDAGASVIALNNLANMVSADPSRLAEALDYARRAHLKAPDSFAVNDTLGWILHLNGKNQEALEALGAAHAAAADNIEVICHLGIVRADLEGVNAARADLEKCAGSDGYPDLSSRAARLLEQS